MAGSGCYTRVTNGRPRGPSRDAVKAGPGEAYAGVATLFSDAAPMLLLPAWISPAADACYPELQLCQEARVDHQERRTTEGSNLVVETMRRAFARLKMGRPGPVMVEIPSDIGAEDVPDELVDSYRPVKVATAGANVAAVDEAAAVLLSASNPIVYAGQGVLYADATDDLWSRQSSADSMTQPAWPSRAASQRNTPCRLDRLGVMNEQRTGSWEPRRVFAVARSPDRHGMTNEHPSENFIQATNDPIRQLARIRRRVHLLGDAKLIIRRDRGCRERLGESGRRDRERSPRLRRRGWSSGTSTKPNEVPMTRTGSYLSSRRTSTKPAIVTHDSGEPGTSSCPFTRRRAAHVFGWGKSMDWELG